MLSDAGLECGLIYLTATGLTKGYFDSTAPIRELLRQCGVHDYSQQGLGQKENGVYLESTFFYRGKAISVPVSIYRPKTKKGDPRMWPSRLKRFADAGDVLALFCHEQKMHFLNLTKEHRQLPVPISTDLDIFLTSLSLAYNQISDELLGILRELANSGPIPADGRGDTSIGRSIETALGIPMNSSQNPDYKGIELKSKRTASATRQSLFAKVPDWKLSAVNSVAELLDKFGYERNGLRRLNCSVYATKVNSQGLFLDLIEDSGQLHELFKNGDSNEKVCLWETRVLHECLLKKHAETFWIAATEMKLNGIRHFALESVHHTRRPSVLHFDRLLTSGEISVDHMIKRNAKGAVRERGPQFKIKAGSLDELFIGQSRSYSLV